MPTLTRGERFKDARTVHNKNGKQSMKVVEEHSGVSASLINSLEDDDSTRSVGYDKVAALAEHYGVSCDYLLGFTNDPSRHPCAADDLGLSINNIDYLKDPSIALGLGCSVPEINKIVRGFLNDILGICRDECLHSEFRIMLNIIARLNGLTKKDTHDDLLSFKDVDEYHRRNGLFVLPAKDGAKYYADQIGAQIGHGLLERYLIPQPEAVVVPTDFFKKGGADGND